MKPFKQATLLFSQDNLSNLASVIPVMDKLDIFLSNSITDPKYDRSLVVALEMARRLLNKYYSKTDLSDIYRIAICEYYTLSPNLTLYSLQIYSLNQCSIRISKPSTCASRVGNRTGSELRSKSRILYSTPKTIMVIRIPKSLLALTALTLHQLYR